AYDWVSRTFFRGEWRHWQRAAIPPLAGIPSTPSLGAGTRPRVLEAGFGTGDLQADLRAAGYAPYGVDLSAAMARIGQRKAHRAGAGAFRLARAATQALPFRTASFAAVVS